MLVAENGKEVKVRVKRAFEVVLDMVIKDCFNKLGIRANVLKFACSYNSGFRELNYVFIVHKSVCSEKLEKALMKYVSHYGVYAEMSKVSDIKTLGVSLKDDEVAYKFPYYWTNKDIGEINDEREAVADAIKRGMISKADIMGTNESSFYNWYTGFLESFSV